MASAAFLLVLLWANVAAAGELVLRNGDRLAGDLIRIQGDILTWKSSTFGEMQIGTNQVKSLTSNAVFKIDGHEEACIWTSVDDGVAGYFCDNGDMGEVSLMSLNMVIPHEQYASGHYSYRGKLALAGRRAAGNTEEETWTVDSEAVFRRGDYRHDMRVNYDSIARNFESRESSGQLNYSLDWFFEEQWFWYNHLRSGFDEPAKIRERYIYGSGVGFQVWENNITALSVETGLDWSKERYYTPDVATSDFVAGARRGAAWRWALNFRYVFPGNMVFFHRHQLAHSLKLSHDWLLESEIGITLPVTGRLFTELRADYDVDNMPAEGGVRGDKQLIFGVGYSW